MKLRYNILSSLIGALGVKLFMDKSWIQVLIPFIIVSLILILIELGFCVVFKRKIEF